MATGVRDSSSGAFHSNDDTIRITPKKTNGTPGRSRLPTPTKSGRPDVATSTTPATRRSPAKNDSPKAIVTNMMIVGHWDISNDGSESIQVAERRAEIAFFLRIVPLPGSTLEVLHLNKNMHLKLGAYRAIPLLPDGSCPREAAGPTALGIPVVEGRYRRTADGKVKLHRRRSSEDSSQDDLVDIDGAYESDGEISNYSGDTVSSSIAAILSPEMFYDGSDDIGNDDYGMVDVSKETNEAHQWLENYNSGTRLTENATGHLCISFDENVRKDPLVVEIYLEAEPIKLLDDPPEDSAFIFAGLPYCKQGINVSFHIESTTSDYEWIYDTKPVLSDVLEIGENWLTGTYYTSTVIKENTLVIRSHQIPRLQVPKDFTVDLITQVSPIPNPDAGNVAIIYSVRIVLNGTHPLEPGRRSSLLFKVYNVQADDKWDLLPSGAEIDDLSEDHITLEIVRGVKETFQDISLTIIAQRNPNSLASIPLPRFVADGGIPLGETVLLEELGDQPIAYTGLESLTSWRRIESNDNPKIWTRAYYSLGETIGSFSFGLVMNALGFPLPGKEIHEGSRNDVVDIVSYTMPSINGIEASTGRSLYTVQMSIRYETNSLAHNERVFTIASRDWRNDTISFNGTYGDGIFQSCNKEKNLWIILNNDYGRSGGPVLMESQWIGPGEEVYLTEDGEIGLHGPEGMDRYMRLEVPYITDKWVHVECKVQRGFHGVESSWLDASIPPRSSSLSPQRLETGPSAGALHGKNLGKPSNHMRRGTLEGETHREEGLYVARKGARIYIYLLAEKTINEGNRVRKTPTVKKVPGSPPEPREVQTNIEGLDRERLNIGELIQRPDVEFADLQDLSKDNLSSDTRSPRVRSPRPLRRESDMSVVSLGSEPLVTSTSETTSVDSSDEEVFILRKPNVKTKSSDSALGTRRISRDKTRRKSNGNSRNSNDFASHDATVPTLPNASWSVSSALWSLARNTLSICIAFFIIIGIFEVYRAISDNIMEIHSVRNEMRRFQNIFEGVYGVGFGDARWRRVRIHQDGDLVVLVRGDAIEEGDLSLERLLSTETLSIDKDALWVERKTASGDAEINERSIDKSGKKVFMLRRKQAHVQEVSDTEGNEQTSREKNSGDRYSTRNDDIMAVATWGRGKEPRLYPWEHVKDVISYAMVKCDEAKETVKDSWAKFLRVWRNVWYMT